MPKTSIKLTGRKSLPHSAFNFDWQDTDNGVVAVFEILDKNCIEEFPLDAKIRVMLRENKNVHFAEFGTIGSVKGSCDLNEVKLVSPSAELRIVHQGTEKEHVLLGSTKLPKINNNGDAEGILHFQKKDTTPFLWDLVIEEDSYPILYLNEKMEERVDPILWVKSNPVFLITVFPTVIEKVFSKIFETEAKLEEGWMYDWVLWAEKSMGCEKFPNGHDQADFSVWLDSAKSTIMAKMALLTDALGGLTKEDK